MVELCCSLVVVFLGQTFFEVVFFRPRPGSAICCIVVFVPVFD